jgi:HAD superfamily hydrolase (TIGR01490 family)
MIRGSSLYFLGRGMYHRGYFSKADISKFVVANVRFRLTGTEKPEVIERFKRAAQDFIGGHAVTDIHKLGEEIYEEYISPALVQKTIDIAKSHLNQGREVWLVSAAPEDLGKIIARKLGFTGAIGSKAEIVNETYTGNLDGPILHGQAKANAVFELVKERNIDIKNCYAYTDSANDLPLLESVGYPNAINPDAKLRIRALVEEWPIHDFRRFRFINRMLGPIVSRVVAVGAYLAPRGRKKPE